MRRSVHDIHTSNASVATAQKENLVSISPVKTKNCNYDNRDGNYSVIIIIMINKLQQENLTQAHIGQHLRWYPSICVGCFVI